MGKMLRFSKRIVPNLERNCILNLQGEVSGPKVAGVGQQCSETRLEGEVKDSSL